MVGGEPVPEREQLAGSGAELVDLLLVSLTGDAHARRDLILVDIESGYSLEHLPHPRLLPSATDTCAAQGNLALNESV